MFYLILGTFMGLISSAGTPRELVLTFELWFEDISVQLNRCCLLSLWFLVILLGDIQMVYVLTSGNNLLNSMVPESSMCWSHWVCPTCNFLCKFQLSFQRAGLNVKASTPWGRKGHFLASCVNLHRNIFLIIMGKKKIKKGALRIFLGLEEFCTDSKMMEYIKSSDKLPDRSHTVVGFEGVLWHFLGKNS